MNFELDKALSIALLTASRLFFAYSVDLILNRTDLTDFEKNAFLDVLKLHEEDKSASWWVLSGQNEKVRQHLPMEELMQCYYDMIERREQKKERKKVS